MKVDLVLWAKNGERTLPYVLDRINKVIPKEVINNRIVVNDHSTDSTAEHIKKCGWTEIQSEGKGISDAANTALKHVETKYFCSFEQDLLLSPLWWNRVSKLVKPGVAAVSGLRFLPQNQFYYNVEPYELTRRDIDYFGGYGKTLDNTLWETDTLRSVGGFPKLTHAGIDTFLLHLFEYKGYQWLVDYDVKSLHLHSGSFFDELRHYYFYGISLPELYTRMENFCHAYDDEDMTHFTIKLAKSPIAGLKMAKKMNDPRLTLAYPCTRLMWLLGFIRGKTWRNNNA